MKSLSGSDLGFEGRDSFFEDGEFFDVNFPFERVLYKFHVSFNDIHIILLWMKYNGKGELQII